MIKYFPIVVFSYNRPLHLKKVLDALEQSNNIQNYKIYLYCDGPKNDSDKIKNTEIKKILENRKNLKFVKKVFRNTNLGLANNIIQSMNEVFAENEASIIFEDDIVPNKYAIDFINFYLNSLNKSDGIGSVSAHSYLDQFNEIKDQNYYISKRHSSWAWGTWSYIWQDIEWEKLNKDKFSDYQNNSPADSFSDLGNDMDLMLWAQSKNYINSWAIRFNYYCYLKNLKSIQSRYSLISNIGNDGSGTHGFFLRKVLKNENMNKKFNFSKLPDLNYNFKNVDLFIKKNHKKSIRLCFYYFCFLIKKFFKIKINKK